MFELDTSVFRPAAFLSLLHLVVTGNVIVKIPEKSEDRAQCFRLDQFVTRRDAAGNLLAFVIQEPTEFASLKPEIRAALATQERFKDGEKSPSNRSRWTFSPTSIGPSVIQLDCLPGGRWHPPDRDPRDLQEGCNPVSTMAGPYVEEYLGDLDSLEALSETLVEGSAASARIVFMVNPAGVHLVEGRHQSPLGRCRLRRCQ